jgi:hypothetical protein
VTRRIVEAVGLCLHDHAADASDEERPADEGVRDLAYVTFEERV